MRDFLLLFTVFIVTATIAGAAAWPLYDGMALERWVDPDKFIKWFALLAVAAATVVTLKHRGLASRTIIGFDARPPGAGNVIGSAANSLGGGFITGVLLLAPLSVALWLFDIRTAQADISLAASAAALAPELFSILLAAFAISLIEEMYFRGVLFGALIRDGRKVAAVLLPAVFYMAVHFLNPREVHAMDIPDWRYGVTLIFSAPAKICGESDCLGAGAALFLAGVLLGLVRLLCGRLVTCIGIHAGWVACIKLTKELTDFNSDAAFAFLAAGHDRFLGVLAALWLTVPCAVLAAVAWRRRNERKLAGRRY